ncbi:MAG: MFS transporter, partial [Bryobacteraceae bacterium]
VFADLFGGITTDRLTRRFGLRVGRASVGGGSLAAAGLFLIAGTFAPDPVLGAVLISMAAASSNFLLGASWGTCIDIGGDNSGVISAAMNTAGQVGGMLNPVIMAMTVDLFGGWTVALCLMGTLYLLGAACWFWVDPTVKVEART